MAGNPNNQKLGKRKITNSQKQPDWLFPATKDAASANPPNEDQSKTKQEKKLAEELLKRRASGEPSKPFPPTELVALVEAFLVENEFTKTSKAFSTERKKKGTEVDAIPGLASLSTIYKEWRKLKDGAVSKKEVESKLQESSEEDASSGSGTSSESDENEDSDVEMKEAHQPKKQTARSSALSASSSSASSISDSDADDEDDEVSVVSVMEVAPKAKVNSLKRKASSNSDSSSSGSDSSSDDEAPKAKKAKVQVSSSSEGSKSDSSSDSESSDSDSSSSEESEAEEADAVSVSAGSGSSSEEDSSSDSDSSTNSAAQKVPLPESGSESSDSDSDSSSDSDSDSDIDPEMSTEKHVASDTSATLSDAPKKTTDSSSSDSSSDSDSDAEENTTKVITTVTKTTIRKLSPPLPPSPVINPSKKQNVPFSRIPKDTKVDERLASNAYVPYDYAQKAHEDLIVTKGRGFTKEKNKKKRGSYRGGYIDVEGKKGIKFED